ncbi:MAG: hypothetical protein AAGF11_30780 [Myxococcota bacterium]
MSSSGAPDELAAHRGITSMPEAWVDLAHGRASPQQALEQALAHEPEALAQRSARMLVPPSATQSRARMEALVEAWTDAPSDERPSPSLSLPSRSASGRWILGVVVMAAAAVLLLVVPQPPPEPVAPPFEAGYALEFHRMLARDRAVTPRPEGERPRHERERPRYRLDRRIELTLRPAHAVRETIDARAFAIRTDGRTVVLPIEPRITPQGVVEIIGQPRAWGLSAGDWQLTLVVGPPGLLPLTAAEVRTDQSAPYEVEQAWVQLLPVAP